jgi:hypothetical protein
MPKDRRALKRKQIRHTRKARAASVRASRFAGNENDRSDAYMRALRAEVKKMTKLFNRKFAAVLLSVAMAAVLFAGFGTPAWAVDDETVSVSVTYGNFDLAGNYTGTGFTNSYFYIEDYELDIDDVQDWVDYGLKETFYLPDPADDPLEGEASVLDAILLAFLYGGFEDITSGWDSINIPNGGYISDVYPQPTTTSLYYYEGPNGNRWGHSEGTGWQIAYILNSSVYDSDALYFSNIPLEDGMDIVFDVSPYEKDWDTGTPWVEN